MTVNEAPCAQQRRPGRAEAALECDRRKLAGLLGEARLETLARELRQARETGLCCAYLFGSIARDQARPGSDLDLAVLFEQDPPHTLAGLHLGLADRLSACLGQSVDLIILNRAPVDLIHRVLRDGLLVLDAHPGRRIAFEVDARNRYFDLLPYVQRYRQPVMEGQR